MDSLLLSRMICAQICNREFEQDPDDDEQSRCTYLINGTTLPFIGTTCKTAVQEQEDRKRNLFHFFSRSDEMKGTSNWKIPKKVNMEFSVSGGLLRKLKTLNWKGASVVVLQNTLIGEMPQDRFDRSSSYELSLSTVLWSQHQRRVAWS